MLCVHISEESVYKLSANAQIPRWSDKYLAYNRKKKLSPFTSMQYAIFNISSILSFSFFVEYADTPASS